MANMWKIVFYRVPGCTYFGRTFYGLHTLPTVGSHVRTENAFPGMSHFKLSWTIFGHWQALIPNSIVRSHYNVSKSHSVLNAFPDIFTLWQRAFVLLSLKLFRTLLSYETSFYFVAWAILGLAECILQSLFTWQQLSLVLHAASTNKTFPIIRIMWLLWRYNQCNSTKSNII